MTPTRENDGTTPAPAGPPDVTDEAALAGLVSRLGSDTLKYLPAVIVPAAASIVGVAIFTRIFPPGAYGQYSLVYVVVATATMLLSGWLQQSVLRYLPRFRADGRLAEFVARLESVLWSFALLSLGVLLLGWPFRSVLGDYARFYLVGVVWTVAGVVFFVQNHVFRSNLQSALFSRYQVAYAVGRLLLGLAYVVLVSDDVIGLAIASAAAYLILVWPGALQIGGLRKKGWRPFSVDRSFLGMLLAYGFPVVGWTLGVRVLDLSDRFIIELFRGSEEVGIYSANYTLVNMGILFVATPLLSAAVPLIVDAWETGHRDRIQSVISSFSRYYLITAAPVVVYTIVYSRELVSVFLGKEYREGYTIIPWVLGGSFVWNFAMYGHKGIKLREKTGVMFGLVAICCVVNVLLNLVIVPKYGYHGAAVTTFASYLLYPVMVYFVTRRYLAWVIPWRSVLGVSLAGIAGGAVWWLCRISFAGRAPVLAVLAVGLVIGTAAYAGALAALRELRPQELRLLALWRRGK
jgi:O-antigen/teichoic acid export membrane protein